MSKTFDIFLFYFGTDSEGWVQVRCAMKTSQRSVKCSKSKVFFGKDLEEGY